METHQVVSLISSTSAVEGPCRISSCATINSSMFHLCFDFPQIDWLLRDLNSSVNWPGGFWLTGSWHCSLTSPGSPTDLHTRWKGLDNGCSTKKLSFTKFFPSDGTGRLWGGVLTTATWRPGSKGEPGTLWYPLLSHRVSPRALAGRFSLVPVRRGVTVTSSRFRMGAGVYSSSPRLWRTPWWLQMSPSMLWCGRMGACAAWTTGTSSCTLSTPPWPAALMAVMSGNGVWNCRGFWTSSTTNPGNIQHRCFVVLVRNHHFKNFKKKKKNVFQENWLFVFCD